MTTENRLHPVDQPATHANRDPRSFGDRPTPPFRPGRDPERRGRFVAKGHDAQLQDAQFTQAPVVLTLMSGGDKITGTIVKRDKFTITVAHDGGEEIFYKHAIESILVKRSEG